MPYDEGLAERVRSHLPRATEERRMFGGLAFMVSGRLCCSVSDKGLLVRVARDGAAELASHPHVRPTVMGRRLMKGYLYVEPPALETDDALVAWLRRAVEAVDSLGSGKR